MKKYTSWVVIGFITALVLACMVWYTNAPGSYDTFAKCISDKKAVFYGAFWCPHCQEQKALLGKSARLLPYVECSTPDGQGQTQICKDKGITGYPTWDFLENGTTTRKSQVLQLSDLSEFTGCPITSN